MAPIFISVKYGWNSLHRIRKPNMPVMIPPKKSVEKKKRSQFRIVTDLILQLLFLSTRFYQPFFKKAIARVNVHKFFTKSHIKNNGETLGKEHF